MNIVINSHCCLNFYLSVGKHAGHLDTVKYLNILYPSKICSQTIQNNLM